MLRLLVAALERRQSAHGVVKVPEPTIARDPAPTYFTNTDDAGVRDVLKMEVLMLVAKSAKRDCKEPANAPRTETMLTLPRNAEQVFS